MIVLNCLKDVSEVLHQNPVKCDREAFNEYFSLLWSKLNEKLVEDDEVDTVDSVTAFLVRSFLGMELHLESNPEYYEIEAHTALRDTLKRIRNHVVKGTFVPEFACKTFVTRSQDLLDAYNSYVNDVLPNLCSEDVAWYEVLGLSERFEMSKILFEVLQGFIHNYGSSCKP